MKRILTFTLALALAAFIFSSCKEKKADPETLTGTVWTTSGTAQVGEDPVMNVPYTGQIKFSPTGNNFDLHYELTIDGNTHKYDDSGEYVYNKPNLQLNIMYEGDVVETIKAVVSGNKMTLTFMEQQIVLKMK